MKKTSIKILLVSVIIIYLIIRYLFTPHMYIDYPCFSYWNDVDHQFVTQNIEIDSIKDLLVVISVYPEHSSGGFCFTESVVKNKNIEYSGHQIKLTNTGLIIDDKIIRPGENFKINKIDIKPENLWWYYNDTIELTNYGKILSVKIRDTIKEFQNPKNLVYGFHKTTESFNYLTALCFAGLIIYLIKLIIKAKSKTNS